MAYGQKGKKLLSQERERERVPEIGIGLCIIRIMQQELAVRLYRIRCARTVSHKCARLCAQVTCTMPVHLRQRLRVSV